MQVPPIPNPPLPAPDDPVPAPAPAPAPSGTSAWQHAAMFFGGITAIVIGAGDAYLKSKFGLGVDVGFIAAGLGVLGVQVSGVLPT